ncbi:Mitochondrial polypeptide chain release factor [Phaffia rhodozyma]|uniref:Mitochondrial polypeptide chain release factor n=1 Tax=Phaffia rhodozyma TaxID=264483 RepID=A0A0F7SIK1_PHARH|nr:Mitochondrial polypeptide chain release factor [Phaffia rhodozyma]
MIQPSQYKQLIDITQAKVELRNKLAAELEATSDQATIIKLSKKIKQLDPVFDKWQEYTQLASALQESIPLLSDPDPSLREMAKDEIQSLEASQIELISQTLPTLLLPPAASSSLSCMVELKAGQGGEEAFLFTYEVAQMYIRYAQKMGWKISMISQSQISVEGGQGYRDCQLEITGEGAFGKLRWESGVHRVQRVPATESKGRTHTSTIAVICLPIEENPAEDDLSYVNEKEVRTDVLRASGAGGQHVNTTESAVRLTHLPTGITVNMQDGRSQHQNREKAWTILRGRLYAHRLAIKQEEDRKTRSALIPGMSRSDKIRTYNFPQDRVTDHRVPVTMNNVPLILSGEDFEELSSTLSDWYLGKRLEGLLVGEEFNADDS